MKAGAQDGITNLFVFTQFQFEGKKRVLEDIIVCALNGCFMYSHCLNCTSAITCSVCAIHSHQENNSAAVN